MNYYRIFPLALLFLMASCSCIQGQNKFQPNSIKIDHELFRAGVLRIEVPQNHPSSFAIQTPSDTWFVVQDSEDNIQILPQPDFDAKQTFEFTVKEMKGTTWFNSVKSTEIIFSEPGSYLIYFSNNLETEPENTYSIQASVYFSK